MVQLRARAWFDALGVQLGIDRVRAHSAGMHAPPDSGEPFVVRMAAERARTMAGGECRRLVEKEELGELAGLQEGAPVPVAKLELTGDPTLAVEAPSDAAMLVVEATAVAVNEATRRNGDELAERCDTVLAQKRFLLEAVTLGAQPSPRRRALILFASSSSDRVLWIEGC